MADLDALLAEAQDSKRKGSCWAARLEGDAKQFVAAARAAQPPPVATKVTNILKREWNIDISSSTVRHHLKGQCSCPKT